MNILYSTTYLICYTISLLPFWVLYRISDILYVLLYHLIKYKRKIVRNNLHISFPHKEKHEILTIEKEFYSFLCDQFVETIKLCSISEKGISKRMLFEGLPEMVNGLKNENKNFAFLYMGHYGNWEWLSLLATKVHEQNPQIVNGYIYYPLKNKVFDKILLKLRNRLGGKSITIKETIHRIIELKENSRKAIIAFVSDQAPLWSGKYHWSNFFQWETPVVTGAEQMGKHVDALIFYAEMERIKRGYYRCKISRMIDDIQQYADYEVTDLFMSKLEQSIHKAPSYWLWTHDRWIRTREEIMVWYKRIIHKKENV
ncbi:MAG: lysophospholipid acyltransferase family protein [Bacteroides nordii]